MTAGSDDHLAVVSFRAGGLRFALEARAVAAMLSDSADAVAFATLMGLEPAEGASRVLAVRCGDHLRRVTVEEPVVNVELAASSIRPLPPLMAAGLSNPAIRALTWDEGGLVILARLQE